jgi:hypothetical protein
MGRRKRFGGKAGLSWQIVKTKGTFCVDGEKHRLWILRIGKSGNVNGEFLAIDCISDFGMIMMVAGFVVQVRFNVSFSLVEKRGM